MDQIDRYHHNRHYITLNQMRICFLCNEYPPGPHGGIGTVTRVLARALVQAGHQVRVVGTYPPGYPAPDYEEDLGVRIWRLREPDYRLGWISARHRLFQIVARWSREAKVDLVEVPDWDGGAAGWPRLPVPVIARLGGSASYFAAELGQPIKRTTFWLDAASLRRADYWASVSRYTANRTQRRFALTRSPIAILYNPVELPTSLPVANRSKNKVVFTGTLAEKKGIISLIRAWPRVVETFKGAELHIFGKDTSTNKGQSMQSYLRSQLDDQAATGVRFHGHVAREKLFEALQIARLGVFPSYAESFGMAPIEAMARGCPTIYTKRFPGPEIIRDRLDGLLVDPDQTNKISDAIICLLADDDLAKRLGDAGRQRVRERFSVDTLLPQNEAFYLWCISDFRRKSTRAA